MTERANSFRMAGQEATTGRAGTEIRPFQPGDSVVYPGHGVGTVIRVESQRFGEHELSVLAISFPQDRMTLHVPVQKVKSSGLREISTQTLMESALAKLSSPPIPSRAMWSRRVLECTAKINSGDPCLIAEVVRDLHGMEGEQRPSYWQRLAYGQALSRLVQELAAVYGTKIEEATTRLELLLGAACRTKQPA